MAACAVQFHPSPYFGEMGLMVENDPLFECRLRFDKAHGMTSGLKTFGIRHFSPRPRITRFRKEFELVGHRIPRAVIMTLQAAHRFM
jgi:hypothetical protein